MSVLSDIIYERANKPQKKKQRCHSFAELTILPILIYFLYINHVKIMAIIQGLL